MLFLVPLGISRPLWLGIERGRKSGNVLLMYVGSLPRFHRLLPSAFAMDSNSLALGCDRRHASIRLRTLFKPFRVMIPYTTLHSIFPGAPYGAIRGMGIVGSPPVGPHPTCMAGVNVPLSGRLIAVPPLPIVWVGLPQQIGILESHFRVRAAFNGCRIGQGFT